MFALTPVQYKVKTFLAEYISAHGFAPSFDEIAVATGLKGKSGVHRVMCALEERGHIERLPSRARAIRVIADDVATARNRAGNVGEGE